MKKTIRSLAFLFAVVSITFIGCKKKETETDNEDYDTQAAQDNAQAEGYFNDFNTMADEAAQDSALSTFRVVNPNSLLTACAHVTVVSNPPGGTITITFDNAGGACYCTGDGRWRKGTLTVTYSGPYHSPGTTITMTASNYYVGGDTTYWYKVEGTRTVTNDGLNTSGNPSFSVSVTDAHLTDYTGRTMTWTSNRTREWTAGDSTLIWTDDVYSISGFASGTSFAGTNYSASITSPLIVALNCHWIKGGSFDFTPDGKAVRSFNFGDGTICDNLATATILGRTFELMLP
jgi:hypothetical protein